MSSLWPGSLGNADPKNRRHDWQLQLVVRVESFFMALLRFRENAFIILFMLSGPRLVSSARLASGSSSQSGSDESVQSSSSLPRPQKLKCQEKLASICSQNNLKIFKASFSSGLASQLTENPAPGTQFSDSWSRWCDSGPARGEEG